MLPGGTSEPFDSGDYLFEVRWDGLRALAFIEAGGYHLQDQSGRNISELFPELNELLLAIRDAEAIGILLIGTITNGLDLLNVSTFWQQLTIGVLIIGAIALDRLTKGARR